MIAINDLTVMYKKKPALNHTSCQFDEKTYVVIGANGAGKTTLFRCITENISKYKGNISFGDNKEPVIGYLPQFFGPFYDLTVEDTLRYLANYKRPDITKEDVDEILNIFELDSLKHKKIKKLSGGMIRKVGIAQAFLGNPDIVLLDEPTTGLDPEERSFFFRKIKEMHFNKTLLIATHILEDVPKLTDEAVVICDGKICEKTFKTHEQDFEEQCLRYFKKDVKRDISKSD